MSSYPQTPQRDPAGGIIAMCAAMGCFIISDVFSKLATTTLPISETITLRGLISTAMFLVPVLMAGTLGLLRTHFSRLWALRVFGEMGGALTFISAITFLPIANVVSISQTSPLIMTALGALLLGEAVGVRRWAATGAGFIGMLLIVKPGASDFNIWSVLAVATTVFIITRDLATRSMDRSIPATLVTLTTAAGVSVAGLALAPFEGAWRMPAVIEWGYLAGAALAVASAYYFSIQAVRKADLSTIAPFRYVILPLSLLAGWLVWSEVPDALAILGIAIIATAGVYTFVREQQIKRAATT